MNKKKKMKKTLKEVRNSFLKEAVASESDLQYIRAKTHHNNHFEARIYVASKILKDRKLTKAYESLAFVHDNYARVIGNDAVTIRQRLEKMLMTQLKSKIKNWDNVYSAL